MYDFEARSCSGCVPYVCLQRLTAWVKIYADAKSHTLMHTSAFVSVLLQARKKKKEKKQSTSCGLKTPSKSYRQRVAFSASPRELAAGFVLTSNIVYACVLGCV